MKEGEGYNLSQPNIQIQIEKTIWKPRDESHNLGVLTRTEKHLVLIISWLTVYTIMILRWKTLRSNAR